VDKFNSISVSGDQFTTGPCSAADLRADMEAARAMGWEVRFHPATGSITCLNPAKPIATLPIPRKARLLLQKIWDESTVLYKPEVRNV